MAYDKEINERLNRAFAAATPDNFEAIKKDCPPKPEKGEPVAMTTKTKRPAWIKWTVGAAAALMLIAGGLLGYRVYRADYSVASTVALEVNPSLEIKVNEKESVLDVIPKNEDAKVVIGDMNFKGSSLEVTTNALIGSMLRNGFLNNSSNSILVSVESRSAEESAVLEQKVTKEINGVLTADNFTGSVLSQTIQPDDTARQIADAYGITVGKAQLIEQIIRLDPRYSMEDLAGLSINELNILQGANGLTLPQVGVQGTASDTAYIGGEAAKSAALQRAGLSESQVTHMKVTMDFEFGVMVYEVEFRCNGMEYDYDINATTGEVVREVIEPDDDYLPSGTQGNTGTTGNNSAVPPTAPSTTSPTNVPTAAPPTAAPTSPPAVQPTTPTQAPTAAPTRPTSAPTTPTRAPTAAPTRPTSAPTSSQGSSDYIGEAAAKQIALSHAGVSTDQAYFTKVKLDRDDGRWVYEIEFICGNVEYEYDINAQTGAIIEYDRDRVDYD